MGRETETLREHYARVWMEGGSWEPEGFKIVKSYPDTEERVRFGVEFVRDEILELRSEQTSNLYRVSLCFSRREPLALDSVQFIRG